MISTEVWRTGSARFDQVGQFKGYPLSETDEEVSQGMAQRLLDYAKRRVHSAGLWCLIASWKPIVGTTDADEAPANRVYYVSWKNEEGTEISVIGIETHRGWPHLDHGLEIQENQ